MHHFETISNQEAAEKKLKCGYYRFFRIKAFTDCIENIAEKGEIAHFEQFHLFPQCFPTAVFFNTLK